jgi:hypothetical protein
MICTFPFLSIRRLLPGRFFQNADDLQCRSLKGILVRFDVCALKLGEAEFAKMVQRSALISQYA